MASVHHKYKTRGTCSTQIEFDMDTDTKVVRNITFQNGCDGNLKAIAALADGLDAPSIISKCGSIRCGSKNTSCSSQLALALRKAETEKD